MFEVEIKIRYGDHAKIRRVLSVLGGKRLARRIEKDVYFTHPQRDFAASDEALRLRCDSEDEVTLTYKGPRRRGELKVREELTVSIDSWREAKKLLCKLDFKPIMTIRKSRELWSLQNSTISLDDVKGLGGFVEIEAVPSNDIRRDMERVKSLTQKLGLSLEDATTKSYLELCLEARKNQPDIMP